MPDAVPSIHEPDNTCCSLSAHLSCFDGLCFIVSCLRCLPVRLQERAAALETELRKSKRAEQKLQALLYRLRQDVSEVKQGAELLAKLEDQRSLEYEVDFLTNKVKVGCRGRCVGGLCAASFFFAAPVLLRATCQHVCCWFVSVCLVPCGNMTGYLRCARSCFLVLLGWLPLFM